MTDHAELFSRLAAGDAAARDELVLGNLGLVHSLVRRFSGRGYDAEDLFQVGVIGLIKSIDRFDPAFDVCFSTYAVPVILGEIRKFLRDDGPVRISRSVKELALAASRAKEALSAETGRSVTVAELAERLDVAPEKLAAALAAVQSPRSIDEEPDDGTDPLSSRLADDGASPERTLSRVALAEGLSALPLTERRVILLRYFRGMTQSAVAERLGVSQVQVSRLEAHARKILADYLS